MGDLIRQAVERVYFVRLDELTLVVYRNGLIGLGRLAEISGTHPARALDLPFSWTRRCSTISSRTAAVSPP